MRDVLKLQYGDVYIQVNPERPKDVEIVVEFLNAILKEEIRLPKKEP